MNHNNIKALITAASLALIPCIAAAQQTENADTLMMSTNPSLTVITETANGIKVTVTDEQGNTETCQKTYSPNAKVESSQWINKVQNITLSEGSLGVKGSQHWSIISGGFGIGLVNASGQPDGFGLQWNKSFEISWVNAIGVRYNNRGFGVSLGLGFDWRNYKMTTSNRMVINDNGGIADAQYPSDVQPRSSRIKIFSLGIPLLVSQKLGHSGLGITGGAILNFNTHASLKTTYRTSSGSEIEEYAEGFHHRKVSVDLFGCLQVWKSCGIYIRYSPQTVLQGHNSPQFKPLSLGLMLFL